MELHGAGYRHGMGHDQELSFRCDLTMAAVIERREARQAAPGSAPEHSLSVPTDLAQALMANPVFKHKVATHAMLVYASR